MPSESTSTSGITTSSSGERHIPSSTRADGSVRKEIRIRPGYRPPEDVEVYKNKTAEAFKHRGKGGVPGADFVNGSEKGNATNKKAKSQSQKPKPQSSPDEREAKADSMINGDVATVASHDSAPADPETEKEKEARKLSKKLRQARELESKKDSGQALLPEQLEKVIKINELIKSLSTLGFDENGEKKS